MIDIKKRSVLLGTEYDTDNVRFIPNMKQNYKYLQSSLSNGHLLDVICGENEKIVFVWDKSKELDILYDLWCKRKL